MRDATPKERFLFPGQLQDKLGAGVLEIGPRGLRLLVPRRFSPATCLAMALAAGIPLISLYLLLFSAYANSYPYWLILNLAMIGWYLASVSLPRTAFWCRISARRPRKVVDLQFRAVELHRWTHWAWVRAQGQETWVRVFGSPKKVATALNLARRTAGVDAALG